LIVIPINIAYNRIKNGGVRMDVLRKEKIYTIDDIYALPDGERAELIDGEIYYMAPPSRTHQRISGKLYQIIANYIDSKGGKCEIYAAPFAVFLNDDDINYLEPDISVICDQSKLDDKGCHGAPDWVIEIVSPSSKPRDYMTKLFKYRTAGVREYWIVDPDKQMTMVYGFEKDTVEQYNFNEDVLVGIYDGFSICIQ
jgi:Uma2 family endonuclease